MGNRFFDPGEERAAKVNSLFGKIAPRYDLINDLQSFGLHRYWKKQMITLANLQAQERALDVCCGTADLALAMATTGAMVAGLDFNEQMLEIGRKKSAARNPAFIRADAQRIPFPEASFEVVTVGYGLRNLASWEAGLIEMLRVTKPGGRVLVLEFGKPKNPLWRALYFGYLRLVVPLLGRIFAGSASAYAYILESLKHYPAQEGLATKMRELRLQNVRVINLLGGVMSINYGEKEAAP